MFRTPSLATADGPVQQHQQNDGRRVGGASSASLAASAPAGFIGFIGCIGPGRRLLDEEG